MGPANDVIVALATAPGYSGVGVIRLSGPDLGLFIEKLLGLKTLTPRLATLCWFYDEQQTYVDQGLALYFSAPNSFTGEEVLELHGHGSPVALSTLIKTCESLGARLAEAGEFTQRAFFNGKLDLTQAEAIIDLIHAESQATVRGALKSLSGVFSKKVEIIKKTLIELRMFIEGSIDFSDEGYDFLSVIPDSLNLENIIHRLESLIIESEQTLVFNQGRQVVLIGAPNVGKSSLLNAMSQEEIAIVTDLPGTTRDAIRHQIVIQGIPFHIIDTAGLRDAEDQVERIGIEKTWKEIEKADIALLVFDIQAGLTQEDFFLLKRLPENLTIIKVANKFDLLKGAASFSDQDCIIVSGKTGFGLEELKKALVGKVGSETSSEPPFLARERHISQLKATLSFLRRAQYLAEIEFVAEELRLAQKELNAITGEFTADDLLGEVFSRFCIGK